MWRLTKYVTVKKGHGYKRDRFIFAYGINTLGSMSSLTNYAEFKYSPTIATTERVRTTAATMMMIDHC